MEFKRVYSSLLDLFPQVDPRALKAVAIEHYKDVDLAVVVVLEEILPLLSEKYTPSACPHEEETNMTELSLLENTHNKMSGDPQSSGTVSEDNCTVGKIVVSSDNVPLHIIEASQVDSTVSEYVAANSKSEFGMNCNIESHLVDDATIQPSGSVSQLVHVSEVQESNLENSNSCLSAHNASNSENVAAEDESSLSATMKLNTMDLIEEIIAEARNNKKTLFAAMKNVISLIEQVEDKERAAEQAKVYAASAGMEIMNNVEDLKKMLEYAKTGNDMDAGDVYGEKAILATEFRELRSRVLSLSDERDNSLAVLEEMRQALEVQLSAIENEIKTAEQEKLDKENVASKLFAEQELVMEKVVQESKNLKQLSKENAELQEFLTDCGHTVDTLQGEIAVICQDVKLLKEKFDQRLPISSSLFQSQTSFILASSNSLLRTPVSDQVPQGDDDSFENENHELEEEGNKDARKGFEDEGWEFY